MKKIDNNFLILIFTLALAFSACKSKKTAEVNHDKEKNKKLKSLSIKKISQELEENYLNFTTFSSKLNIRYFSQDKDQSVKANLRISRDSTIWISIVPALGIEMARVSLTKDSVKFINKLTSQYFVGDYEYLSDMFHLDLNYDLIQALLMDELFMYPLPEDSTKIKQHFSAKNDSANYFLTSVKEKKVKRLQKKNKTEGLIDQNVIINPDFFKIEEVQISDYDLDLFFDIKYSSFIQNDTTRYFPQQSEIDIKFEDNIIKISLKYSKITLNKAMKFSFEIPEKYERINKQQ